MSNTPTTSFPTPKVIIDRMALEKIRYFVNKDDKECSGMGITRVVGDTIFVDDVEMVEQKNGASHTDINEEGINKLMFKWREREGNINYWWHSHVNMSVFWSGQDETTIKQLAQHGMCVASVFNKKGEIRTAVAAKIETPFTIGSQIMMFDQLTLLAQTRIPNDLREAWDKEHEQNVKKTYYPVVYTGGERGPRLSDGDDDTWGDGGWSHGRYYGPNCRSDNFRYVQTKHPDYWDSLDQGRCYDTDWVSGSQLEPGHGYKKSDLYKKQLAAWMDAEVEKRKNAPAVPPPPPVVGLANGAKPGAGGGDETSKRLAKVHAQDVQSKHIFAVHNDEIADYLEEEDKFELFNGAKIRASWYMSDGCALFRIRAKEMFSRALKLQQDRMALMAKSESGSAGQQQLAQMEIDEIDVRSEIEMEDSAKELAKEIKELQDEAPNPNHFSEEDLEQLYASVTGR